MVSSYLISPSSYLDEGREAFPLPLPLSEVKRFDIQSKKKKRKKEKGFFISCSPFPSCLLSAGKSITTTPKDWPSERVVYVLEDELYYDSNFQSFRVLHISQPLIGRSSAPTSSSSSSSSSQSRDYPNELGGSGMLSASSSSHSLQRTKSEELKSGGGTGGGYSDGRSWDNSGRDSSSSGSGGGGGGGGDSGGGGGEHSFLNRMNSSPAQWRRCLHTLCGAPSPAVFGRNLLEPLRQYVQTFNDGFVLVKGERFMKLTAETLKTECGRLARTAIQASGELSRGIAVSTQSVCKPPDGWMDVFDCSSDLFSFDFFCSAALHGQVGD